MTTETDNQQFKTPMMQQYLRIKKEYPDCILLFRMGDFYEMFLDDAIAGSEILDIALTARSKGSDGKIPMCGVPYHSVDSYLSKIIKAGRKAAICEQMSKPKPGVELVERRVVRIVTPGTLVDDTLLENNSNNFLMTFMIFTNTINFAYTDISTGEFFVFEIHHDSSTNVHANRKSIYAQIANEVKRINPSEIILASHLYNEFDLLNAIQTVSNSNIFPFSKVDNIKADEAAHHLKKFFNIKTLEVFSINENDEQTIKTASTLLSYIENNLKEQIKHIKCIKNTSTAKYMRIDSETINNLEIFESNRMGSSKNQKLSLFSILNATQTAMGERMLRNWILFPLINKQEIEDRQNAVVNFLKSGLRDTRENLKQISDIERIASRLGTNRGNARDLINLSNSLEKVLQVIEKTSHLKALSKLNQKITYSKENIEGLITLINSSIKIGAPLSIREGNLIRDGYNNGLDQMKNAIHESKEWIAALENIEKQRTGINNLKVGFNSVFGYYIEITKSNISMAPANYIRKQTLVNAERYITQELKEKEDIVLTAEEKINELEFDLFTKITNKVMESVEDLQSCAQIISCIDCVASFAQKALEKNYVKPLIIDSEKYTFIVEEGRHPVVEASLNTGEFTPNSTHLTEKEFIHLITGPNMAGKSTYIRQIALIQLMAQIGSYIPAFTAEIAITDAIYTRIGAGDALAQGLSTFMVEMIETANILNNATNHSLIILDEVGRGTSTIDGLSIAKAVLEYIHSKIQCKTLFATHFHELIHLNQRLKHMGNYHVRVNEEGGEIKFLHKVEKGGTDKSYGIEVARLAGIPEEVIDRARYFLNDNTTKQMKLEF